MRQAHDGALFRGLLCLSEAASSSCWDLCTEDDSHWNSFMHLLPIYLSCNLLSKPGIKHFSFSTAYFLLQTQSGFKISGAVGLRYCILFLMCIKEVYCNCCQFNWSLFVLVQRSAMQRPYAMTTPVGLGSTSIYTLTRKEPSRGQR